MIRKTVLINEDWKFVKKNVGAFGALFFRLYKYCQNIII
jgi:hypothetical protein